MTAAVARVVVVGSDSVAWLAAAALKRAFNHRQLDVVVADCAPSPNQVLGRWTLPSLRALHTLLGINEDELVRRTGATFKLATEHVGWRGDSTRFMHPHGELGVQLGDSAFYKYLLLQAIGGRIEHAENYSVAALAADQGRFTRPVQDEQSLLSSYTYALHLDEAAYCAFIRAHAQTLGVRLAGVFADVSLRADGAVAALVLANGEQLNADYFVDCSGSQSLLMNKLLAVDREDWSQWLTCDRMISVPAPIAKYPPPLTRTIASDAGWLWRMPLQHCSVVGHVYSSAFKNDDEALHQLVSAVTDGKCGPAVVNRFKAGRRRQFWVGNCVAIGDAAVMLEPLAGADLQVAQLGISNLVELFPLDKQSSVEAVEYNRLMAEHADALRDFTMAHYRAGVPRQGAFWAATRAVPSPQRLAHKLDLFSANGRIALLDHETFEEVDWPG